MTRYQQGLSTEHPAPIEAIEELIACIESDIREKEILEARTGEKEVFLNDTIGQWEYYKGCRDRKRGIM